LVAVAVVLQPLQAIRARLTVWLERQVKSCQVCHQALLAVALAVAAVAQLAAVVAVLVAAAI
jgi:hypothetical protein